MTIKQLSSVRPMTSGKIAYFFARALDDIPLSYRQDYGIKAESVSGDGVTWRLSKPIFCDPSIRGCREAEDFER